MASIPKPIRDWISQFFTEKGVPESSSDVNHDQTSNRTHEGDDLSPATLEASDSVTANGTEYLGNFATEDDLPDPSNVAVGAEATVVSDPNGQTSVYKLVDE